MAEIEENTRIKKNLQTQISESDYKKWEKKAHDSNYDSVFTYLKVISSKFLNGELIVGDELIQMKAENEKLQARYDSLMEQFDKLKDSLEVEIQNRTKIYETGLVHGQKMLGVIKSKATEYDKIIVEFEKRPHGCSWGDCICKKKEILAGNQTIKGIETFQNDILTVLKDRI